MTIKDFTEPELDFFRRQGNFVGHERELFELRSQGVPLEEIADILGMTDSGIRKVSQKVNRKIIRVL